MAAPLVSVVIVTRNSGGTLPFVLASLRRQSFGDFEVIVVDNYSSDGTRDIARGFGARVYLCGGERSRQKNYGAMVARGEYLYFIDSDFVLHPYLIEECVSLMDRGADAVIVSNISYPGVSRVARARFYERLSYRGSGLYEAARFIKTKLFHEVGGYSEDLYANEDYELHSRLVSRGARIGRTEKSYEVHIGEPRSIGELIWKNYYYGSSLNIYFRKTKNALHALPLRHTYLDKRILASIMRRWPLGIVYMPLIRMTQGLAALTGMILAGKHASATKKPDNSYSDCKPIP